jgi:hypothetical protein
MLLKPKKNTLAIDLVQDDDPAAFPMAAGAER